MNRLTTPFIIADIGSNWKQFERSEQNFECALSHIQKAAECGVSAVKFQLFTAEELYGTPGIHPYALPRDWLPILSNEADSCNVEFMCTAFSPEGVWEVNPYVRCHKIASAEFCHEALWEAYLETGKRIIASTGAKTEAEIIHFLNLTSVKGLASELVYFLECVAAYPAQTNEYSLNQIRFFVQRHIPCGVSDHTLSPALALAALGAGATVFEKHFHVREGALFTPDLPHSVGMEGMAQYCRYLKEASGALTEKIKTPVESELPMLLRHNRRLMAIKPIPRGERLLPGDNFGVYRSLEDAPEAASPLYFTEFIGKVVNRAILPGEGIKREDIF